MKRILIVLFTIIVLVTIFVFVIHFSQNEKEDKKDIVIGKKDFLFSKILDEEREIWVSVPSDFREDLKGQHFPIVIVLDGPVHFYSVVGMIDHFSWYNDACPPMIVVGLKNTDRNRDFIPKINDDLFSLFLKNELIPYIDRTYPTRPFRVLIGHSLAGLRVVKTAIYDRGFNAFITIDPSLTDIENDWYNKARNDIENFQFKDERFYLGMAHYIPFTASKNIEIIKKDTSADSEHMRRIIEFSEKMTSKNSLESNSFRWKYYPNENHQSVAQITIYDGLEFIFDWYKPKYLNEFVAVETSPQRAVDLYDNYYKTISKNLGYEIKPPFDESLLIRSLVHIGQRSKALALAKYNLKIHSDSKPAKEWIERLEKEISEK
jgi:uncharacterized protein